MQNSTSVFKEIDNYKNANTIVKPLKIEVLQNYLNKLNNPDGKEIKTSKTNEKITKENCKVLIVEDNKINMLLTKTLLTKRFSKVSIFEAENGLEAVQNYKIYKPDIVLMDIQMPVMNGYEATKEIRKMNPKAIIIALTAGAIAGEKEKCLDFGMNDFILKPIDKTVFDNTILKWIKTL
ncbi:MAG: response regulator [Flavobacteriaceae bacterium]|nr:response regulator [Flavobacteriaceae bacterium]